jgi:trimethylamine--corrinoid protein Co-methyltransferase
MKKFLTELTILDEKDIGKIHNTSLRILEEVGLYVPDDEILQILEANDAIIDWDKNVVRFPESLVMKSVRGIKKSFQQAPTYFGRHIELNKGEFILWMCSQPEIIDLLHNEKHRGTHDDMIKGIVVENALENVGVIEPYGIPREVVPEVADVYCYRYLYTYSKKPCSTWIYSENSARHILEMAKVIANEKSCKDLPLMYFAETVSPLRYSSHTLKIMRLMAEHKVPIYIGPMVTAGGSGPVTLAGTIALCNAEILSEIVLVWLLNPGQALVYPGISSILDLRNALISYGAPEQALLSIAAVQMAKYYGMGCCCNVHLSDSNLCDFQRGYEGAATASFALAAGVEMIGIVGYAGAGFMCCNPGCQSLEQLVIDDECAEYMKRVMRGFDVNDETLAFELIRTVGIGGTFIDKEHTVKHMREEHFFPELFNRDSYDIWKKNGATSIDERARVRLRQILEKHYPPDPVIDRNTEKTLEEIYKSALTEFQNR